MFFKKLPNRQNFKNFSITLLVRNDIHSYLNTSNWFLENIILINELYLNKFNLRLDDIDINFGKYHFSSIENALNKIKQQNLSFFLAQTKKIDRVLIIYDNPFLNQEELNYDNTYEARFVIMCPYEYKEVLLDFITKNIDLDNWDYGYGMSLLENQTLEGSQIKSTIFSSRNIPLLSEKIWNEMLLTRDSLAEKGFIKDIYEFNILNHKQAENINLKSFLERGIGSYSIKNEKYIWKLNFTEINLVKRLISTNPFLLSMTKDKS
jgi:hypothetical protein